MRMIILVVCAFFALTVVAQKASRGPVEVLGYSGDTVDTKVLVPARPATMEPRVTQARVNLRIGRNDWVGFIVYHKPTGQPIVAIDSVRYKLINADSADVLVKMPIRFINPDIDTLP
jgi:hypothetical protein